MLARRVFADGRTRAYAWGRSAAREDVAARGERLIAMSGQFEQRAARAARVPARRARRVRRRGAAAPPARSARARLARAAAQRAGGTTSSTPRRGRGRGALAELRALVEDTDGLEPGAEECAARRARAAAPRDRARARARPRRPKRSRPRTARARPAWSRGRACARAARAARARARRARRRAARRRAAAARDGDASCARFLASLEAEPGRLEQVEGELERIADARRRFRCATYEELLERAAAARAELAALEERRRSRCRGRGGARRRRRSASTALAAAAPRRARGGGASRSRTPSRPSSRDRRWATASSTSSSRERDPGAVRRRRGRRSSIRPNRGPAVRARRRDRVRRRAVPRRARDRGGRRRRDDGLRRDRRRHRRSDRARGRRARSQRLAERAQVITITHLPQIASRRRPALPRREGARRPDAHADRAARTRTSAEEELERMLGGRGVPGVDRCDAGTLTMQLRRVHGHRRGSTGARSTSSAGWARTTSRSSTTPTSTASRPRSSLESGVRVVVNVVAVPDRPLPEPGAAAARARRRAPDRRARRRPLRRGPRRASWLTVRGASSSATATRLAAGRALGADELAAALAEQRGRVTEALEEFADNTMRYLRDEGQPARRGHRLPAARIRGSATGTRSSSRGGPATSATCGSSGRTSATSSRC